MADELDPRFEPEFQRGYDPSLHRGRRRSETGRATSPLPEPPAVAPPAAPAPVLTEVDEDAVPRTTRRNPFLVALPVIGAGLLGGFALVFARFVNAYQRQFDGRIVRDDYFWLTLANAVFPALLIGGLLCFTLWLALLALTPARSDE